MLKSHFIDELLSPLCDLSPQYPTPALRTPDKKVHNQKDGMLFGLLSMLIVWTNGTYLSSRAMHPPSQEAGLPGSFSGRFNVHSIELDNLNSLKNNTSIF